VAAIRLAWVQSAGLFQTLIPGTAMNEHSVGISLRTLARIGGVLYLIIIVGGTFGEAFIRGRVMVPDDPAATVANLQSMETLWRLGIASELFMLSCTVALTLIFYVLLRPVSRDLALLAVFFNLVSATLEATGDSQHLMAALFPLEDAGYLGALDAAQRSALASLALTAHGHSFGTALIFFGWECLVLGYLIYRSGYFPKWIGVLMGLAGVGYLINSFAMILSPALASLLFPAILLPALVGESSLALWLLVKGVDEDAWRRQGAGAAFREAPVAA